MATLVVEELREVGELLRKRRKEMGLAVKEVENATSIRSGYLQAIEEGEMGKLISPVYAQGFVKQYANFLGLDGEALVRERPELFNRKEQHEFAYGIGTLEMRGHPGSSAKWMPNVLWIVAFVLLFLVAWYFARVFEIL